MRRARGGFGLLLAASFAGCLDWNGLYGQLEVKSCGDGLTSGTEEECDDANTDQDDACPLDCRAARCGDGAVWVSVEDCDDGNTSNDDGCSDACRVETELCGNRTREGLEECDDGNRSGGDGCSARCRREPAPELCGNSRRDPDEACDDGNDANDDACLKGCSLAACGDGFVWRGAEQCDDGNSDNQDECSRTCLTCRQVDGTFFRTANGHCYALHPEPRTFNEATDVCDAAGAHVWTTTNAAEVRDVNRSLVKSTAATWIGFRTSPSPAGWITGEATSFQAWSPGEPSAPSSGCAVQVADSSFAALWRSATCSDRYPFVCETQPALVFAATHHAYILHTGTRSWADARDACAGAGGYLVSVETAEEHAFMAQHFSLEVWLGATRDPGGAFQWLSGAPVGFTAFGKNQPDNAGGNEDCLLFNRFGAWNDSDCKLNRRFVCEFD